MLGNLPQLITGLNASDALLPWKADAPPQLPERELLAAILLDAVKVYRGEIEATQGERAESYRWFRDPTRGRISLTDVAEVLGLDVAVVQDAVNHRQQRRAA